MKSFKTGMLLCVSVFFAILAVGGFNASADEKGGAAIAENLREMPLLTGETWQKMTLDEKVAFVWGMGHVATMERETAELYPELKKRSFASKLCSGIAGIPMNRIVNDIDGFYKDNPGKTAEPVIKVMWDKYVTPGMKTGVTDLPDLPAK